MSAKRSASHTSRKKNAVQSFKSAAEAIGKIEKDCSMFAITRGQWSMLDAVMHCLKEVGPSKITLWTWTVASYEVDALNALIDSGGITGGTLIIDYGGRKRTGEIIANWKSKFGADSVRYVVNHAKIATIESESGMKLLLRGSMNLNFNPRFEQFDMSEGGPEFDLVREIESELPILEDDCSGPQAYEASKVANAFGKEQLAMFAGTKVWAK